jgi:hypothetical protein
MNRLVIPMIAMCLSITGWSPAVVAQDRVLAEENLDSLWAALATGQVRIPSNQDLVVEIMKYKVAVLVVPAAQPNNQIVIRKCLRGETKLVDETLSKEDFAVLLKFVNATLVATVEQLRRALASTDAGSGNHQDVLRKKVMDEIHALPPDQRASAQLYVGARLANLDPKEHDLAESVKTYRSFLDQQVQSKLADPAFKANLKEGNPYAFGGRTVKLDDLKALPPENIKVIEVGGKRYSQAWIDGSMVIVPHPPNAPPPPAHAEPLDKLKLSTSIVNDIKKGTPASKSHIEIHTTHK